MFDERLTSNEAATPPGGPSVSQGAQFIHASKIDQIIEPGAKENSSLTHRMTTRSVHAVSTTHNARSDATANYQAAPSDLPPMTVSATSPAVPATTNNVTLSRFSRRPAQHAVAPFSSSARAALTRSYSDFPNMPAGLTTREQLQFIAQDRAAYDPATHNTLLAAEHGDHNVRSELPAPPVLSNQLPAMSTTAPAPSTAPPASPAPALPPHLTSLDPTTLFPAALDPAPDAHTRFTTAVEAVLAANYDVRNPPTLQDMRAMTPWERAVRAEAHREAMRRRHRVLWGEANYARLTAANVRAEELEPEEVCEVLEAVRGFRGLAYEKPKVGVKREDSDSDSDEDEWYQEYGKPPRKRVKREVLSPSPEEKKVPRRSYTGRRSYMGRPPRMTMMGALPEDDVKKEEPDEEEKEESESDDDIKDESDDDGGYAGF